MLSKIEQVGQWGTNRTENSSELKRIRTTNYSLIIAIFTTVTFHIFYTVVDFWLLLPVIINYDIFLFVFVTGLFLNKNNHHTWAKLFLHFGIFTPTFIHTVLLSGNEPGIHYYFLMYALLPVLYWSLKDFRFILFFLLINLASFIYVEFFTLAENMPIPFPENSVFFFRLISMILSFLSIAILILLYQYQAEHNEKVLSKQSENLKDNNTKLLQKAEEILVQKEQIEEQRNELQHANNTKDKFFSIIAHDLKSPFNALLGFSELLLTKNKEYDADKREKMIKIIYNTADQTLNLLNNLLIWSKIETGEIYFNPKKIRIDKIIDETVLLLKNIASKKNIEISYKTQNNLFVFADEDMIATVMRNLISNAMKFSHKGSVIKIEEQQIDNNRIQISVSDNGVGIQSEKLKSIFDTDAAISTKGTEGEKGTGLGLKLCKEFIKENNGQIWVKSEANKGSTFYFTLAISTT